MCKCFFTFFCKKESAVRYRKRPLFHIPQADYLLPVFFRFFNSSKITSLKDLDIRSLHTGGPGLDDTGALKFPQSVYDNGTGDAHTVCDLAGNQDPFISVQLVENMRDGFQL